MIPLNDIKAHNGAIAQEIQQAVAETLANGHYILGPEVAAFERDFAAYCGVKHGIGVNSGTSALHLALLACGVGEGDEVITVPYTFVATTAAIRYTNARPVFVDIDPATYTLDVNQLEAAITRRTKAILPVHLYGQMADMDAILEIADRHGLPVIEDAAQAHGALYKGRRAGSTGRFGCFSFYPTKNLGACGEGGLITTNSDEDAKQLRMLRDWGTEAKNYHILRGYNYRLEGVQGAILRVKFRYLEQWTELRRAHAAYYGQALEESDVMRPKAASYNRHVYHLYVIQADDRDQLQRELLANGVQTAVYYPLPIHLQPAHSDLGYKRGEFPVAERVAGRVLAIPMYPELTDTQREKVAVAVRQLCPLGV